MVRMTQQQIAREVGLSQASVSLVLRDPATSKVSADKKGRILALSRRLRRPVGKSAPGPLALLVWGSYDLRDAYYSRFVRGIEAAASGMRRALVVRHLDEGEVLGLSHVRALGEGAILMGVFKREQVVSLSSGMPTVLLNRVLPEVGRPMVTSDQFGAMHQVVAHLHGLGHRRIAFLGMDFSRILDKPELLHERLGGYYGAMRRLGMVPDPRWVRLYNELEAPAGRVGEESIEAAVRFWKRLAAPPTAVCCFNDVLAVSLLHHALREGIAVPGELSVVGFDNTLRCEAAFPHLASVDQPMEAMGRAAVELLHAQIAGPGVDGALRVSCPCHLVVRESVGPVAATVLSKRGGGR